MNSEDGTPMPCYRLDDAVPYLRRCGAGAPTRPRKSLFHDVEPWSCGFRPPGLLHDDHAPSLGHDIALAGRLAARMSAHKLSSDSDVPFFAFVGELDSPDDSPEGRLLTALGIPHGLPVRIHDITSRTHFAWNVSDFGDDPLSDYYSEDELTAYAETTALMRQHLTRLWMGSFAPVDVVYPVFWYGQSGSGNLVGVFSVRTDT